MVSIRHPLKKALLVAGLWMSSGHSNGSRFQTGFTFYGCLMDCIYTPFTNLICSNCRFQSKLQNRVENFFICSFIRIPSTKSAPRSLQLQSPALIYCQTIVSKIIHSPHRFVVEMARLMCPNPNLQVIIFDFFE